MSQIPFIVLGLIIVGFLMALPGCSEREEQTRYYAENI